MLTYSYYPGCSLHSSARGYDASIREVFDAVKLDVAEIADWNCCGASSAHSLDEHLAHALCARNLSIAEREGRPLIVPCSACYARLLATNTALARDPALSKDVNGLIEPASYSGGTEVRSILDILARDVGARHISSKVTRSLSGLRAVCYYGCLLTRIPRAEVADDVENPASMDEIVGALGADVIDWPSKTDCCGASLSVSQREVMLEMAGRILSMAVEAEAACLVTSCPLCQMNLDAHQGRVRRHAGIEAELPVFFVTELIAYALGSANTDSFWRGHFVHPRRVLE